MNYLFARWIGLFLFLATVISAMAWHIYGVN